MSLIPLLVLSLAPGCNRDRAQAEAVAAELCRWGQLENLTPSVLPEQVDLEVLVREADRRYALDLSKSTISEDNPFLALNQTVGMVVDEPAAAMAEALSKRAKCTVAVTVEGDRASAHVERSVGIPVAGETEVFLLLRELNQLGSREARVAAIEARIDAAKETRSTSVDMVIERVGERWVANLGLPERAIARSEAQLADLRKAIEFGERSEAALAKLVVVGTHYFHRSSKRSSIPRVDITIRNDTQDTFTGVDFHGTLTSEGRERPWVDAELPHRVRGKFAPGALEEWTIVSRLPIKWRTAAPDGSVVAVRPIRARGTDGEILYNLDGFEEAKAAAAVLEEEIGRLRTTYLSAAGS